MISQYCYKGSYIRVLMRNNMVFEGNVIEWDRGDQAGIIELNSGNLIILNPIDVLVIKIILHEEQDDTDPAPAPATDIIDDDAVGDAVNNIQQQEDNVAFEIIDESSEEYQYHQHMQQENSENNAVEEDVPDDLETKLKLRTKSLVELHGEKARLEREIIARKLTSKEVRGIVETNYDIPRKLYDKEPSALIRSRKKDK